MIEINVDHEQDLKSVTMGGSLTVEHAAEMHATLKDAVTAPLSDIKLTLGNITNVDVTFFQLVCSVHKKVTDAGKRLIVERYQQDSMRRALRLMGFARSKGCSCDSAQPCLLVRMSA